MGAEWVLTECLQMIQETQNTAAADQCRYEQLIRDARAEVDGERSPVVLCASIDRGRRNLDAI